MRWILVCSTPGRRDRAAVKARGKAMLAVLVFSEEMAKSQTTPTGALLLSYRHPTSG
jgi:hypothetical protein